MVKSRSGPRLGNADPHPLSADGSGHLVYAEQNTGFLWHARSLQLVEPAWVPPVAAITAATLQASRSMSRAQSRTLHW